MKILPNFVLGKENMGYWKVSREALRLYPHPNADRLEVARVGTYALVVQKGLHRDGDEVIFAPKNSVLPDYLVEVYGEYLGGKDGNRVREIRLRGEPSQGIIIRPEVLEHEVVSELGEDISAQLGITEYQPPIPQNLSGTVFRSILPYTVGFDLDGYRIHQDKLEEGENVIITEKLHGSQINIFQFNGEVYVTSKGQLRRGLFIERDYVNSYWDAVRLTGVEKKLDEFIERKFPHAITIQLVGEMIPCQKGYSYGQSKPTIRLFEVLVDGESQPVASFCEELMVPVLYEGPFSEEVALQMSKGLEQVSGRGLHIREGCVIRPTSPRGVQDGRNVRLKLINPKYQETGEEFN